MHQLDGHTSGLREVWGVHAAGMGYRGAKLGPDTGTARKNSMSHGCNQPGRCMGTDGLLEMRGQRLLCQLV
jgi:hypothetical protein